MVTLYHGCYLAAIWAIATAASDGGSYGGTHRARGTGHGARGGTAPSGTPDSVAKPKDRQKANAITIPAVKTLPAGTALWDGDVHGFGVRRQRRDAVYILKYRLRGRQRFLTIGAHGKGWTVESARREAKRLLGLIASGIDPANARDAANLDPSINVLLDLYLTEGCGEKKPSTLIRDRSRIDRHLRPLIGKLNLGNLTRADIERLKLDVTNGLTRRDERTGSRGRSIVTGGAGAAIECVALLSSVLTFAVRRGLRRENPALGIDLRRTKRRRYPTADELARLGVTLARMEAGRADPFAVAAIRFLSLSGCRKGEALNLKWEQVDFQRGVLCLSDSKVGARDVPVGYPALKLLLALPRVEKNPYVFPGRTLGKPIVGLQKVWERVRAIAGFNDLRLHDLRHGFASVGVNRGVSLTLLQGLLGHSSPTTTSRYAHLQTDPMRAEADRIAGAINDALGNNIELSSSPS
jgi:integrase